MHNIFYSDDSMKAQEAKATFLSGISGKASAKVHIDPKNLVEAHPIFQKLRAQSLEMIFESAGELMRLFPHHFLYKEGDHAYSGYIIVAGKVELWGNSTGTLGTFLGGDTLGEEGIIDGDKAVVRNQDGIPLR
jgi:CRP-like cAMP-binding protein